jgi:hypothetical protein
MSNWLPGVPARGRDTRDPSFRPRSSSGISSKSYGFDHDSGASSCSNLLASSGVLLPRPFELYARLLPLPLVVLLRVERVYGTLGAGETGDGRVSLSARSNPRLKSSRRCMLVGRERDAMGEDWLDRSEERCRLKCESRFDGVSSSCRSITVCAMTTRNSNVTASQSHKHDAFPEGVSWQQRDSSQGSPASYCDAQRIHAPTVTCLGFTNAAVAGLNGYRQGCVVLSFMHAGEAGLGASEMPERGCYRWDVGTYQHHMPLSPATTASNRLSTYKLKNIWSCRTHIAVMSIPKNAHILSHPCLKAKLSQLRSAKTSSRDAQALVHEIALMVGYEALGAGLKVQEDGTVSRLISFLHVIKDSNACTKVYRPDIYLHQHNNPLHLLYVKSNSKLIY